MNTNSDDFNGALSPLRVYPDEMPNRGEDHDIGRRDHSLIAREVLAMPPRGAEKDVAGMQQMHRTSLVTAWVSSLISFSVLASAKHKNFDYSDSTACRRHPARKGKRLPPLAECKAEPCDKISPHAVGVKLQLP